MNNDGIPDYYKVGIAAADNNDDDTDSHSDAFDVEVEGSGHSSSKDLLSNYFIETFDKPDG